jgi:hypothetical protein
MGFCQLTCAECKGTGHKEQPFNGVLTRGMQYVYCTNCGGKGTILVHAGAIGSVQISVDPAASADEAWAVAWKRHDDGKLEVLDMEKVSRLSGTKPTIAIVDEPFTPTPGNPSPHLYRCTSGLGENCCCYACHGG